MKRNTTFITFYCTYRRLFLNFFSTEQIKGDRKSEGNSPATNMPPRRKRSSPSTDDHKVKKAKTTSSSSRNKSSKLASQDSFEDEFSKKKCTAWFHEYTLPGEDVIGPEGMEKFCEDIGVEPENVVMLVIAWKMDAKQMGFFTLQEWLLGLTELRCDCVSRLQSKLEYSRSLLDDSVIFKSIYRYAYDFARDKDQRSMDIETAKAMLSLLLGKHWALHSSFHQFLEQSRYKVVNKDQWCNILEFSRGINTELSNYDEDGAWPVLLDEFVEWQRQRKAEHST